LPYRLNNLQLSIIQMKVCELIEKKRNYAFHVGSESVAENLVGLT